MSYTINTQKLDETIAKIFQPNKGILAADESTASTPKRLNPIGLENTKENRQRFRDLLINTEGIEENLSGVILHDETFWQENLDGEKFVIQLQNKGIIPGIKVDAGLRVLPNTDGEKFTQGLDNLDDRLEQYADAGAGFAKWRAAFAIDVEKGLPSANTIRVNSNMMAIYAGMCQRNGIVPIVEPEVLITGTYSIEEKRDVMRNIFKDLFMVLEKHGVYMPGVILKTSIVHSGREAEEWATDDQVAQETTSLLAEYVPENIGGVVFLSGGLSGETAVRYLNLISQTQSTAMKQKTTFSYARAVQEEPTRIWGGDDANLDTARDKYRELLKNQGLAERGKL